MSRFLDMCHRTKYQLRCPLECATDQRNRLTSERCDSTINDLQSAVLIFGLWPCIVDVTVQLRGNERCPDVIVPWHIALRQKRCKRNLEMLTALPGSVPPAKVPMAQVSKNGYGCQFPCNIGY